jgi:hypothetical protein
MGSGRVLVRGLSGVEEVTVLQRLQDVLLGEFSRPGMADAMFEGAVVLVVDGDAKKLLWRDKGHGRHLVTVPRSLDVQRLRLVLRSIIGKVTAARMREATDSDDWQPV